MGFGKIAVMNIPVSLHDKDKHEMCLDILLLASPKGVLEKTKSGVNKGESAEVADEQREKRSSSEVDRRVTE